LEVSSDIRRFSVKKSILAHRSGHKIGLIYYIGCCELLPHQPGYKTQKIVISLSSRKSEAIAIDFEPEISQSGGLQISIKHDMP